MKPIEIIGSDMLKKLADAGFVVVPYNVTGAMQAAAYYVGGVGDHGGAERASFVAEWDAAIEQFETGGKPTGLLALVRPVTWDDDEAA